jgi:hypothetical protein
VKPIGAIGAAVVVASMVFAAMTAHAQDVWPPKEVPPVPKVQEIPSGYVFEKPRLLTQQLLWGIVHGVRLLGMACQKRGDTAAALAYVEWAERQGTRIRAAERDLARHYFEREEAPMELIDAAIRLRPALDESPETLEAACATLPEALTAERYDLERYYREATKQ